MRPRCTTGVSKDLSDHFASGRGSYKQALLSDNFSAVLQNSGIARRSPSASGTKRPLSCFKPTLGQHDQLPL